MNEEEVTTEKLREMFLKNEITFLHYAQSIIKLIGIEKFIEAFDESLQSGYSKNFLTEPPPKALSSLVCKSVLQNASETRRFERLVIEEEKLDEE